MRPLRLRMSAFGPFAGVEEIDFTLLGDNPLFLINGPTGSGKSTILDAICFALYGETTGNDREGKQMRCDHANPDTLTEISLEFTLASGRYRIVRIPDQFRPKSRGEGFTEQKARAELYKFEGDQEQLIVAPKITEVTDEIINLTGLSAEQFRQVMVLPQGKFRDLLLARSEEREAIFQQLFQTHVYSALQAKLRDQANALSAQIKESLLQQRALLGANDLENGEQLLTEMEALQAQIKTLTEQKQQAEESLRKAQDELQQAQQVEKLFNEQEQVQARLIALQTRLPEIEKQKTQLEQTKKAREIEPLYLETQKQQTALVKAQQQLEACEQAMNTAGKALQDLELEKQSLPEREKALEKQNTSIVELENYRQRSQQLQNAQAQLRKAEKELAESERLGAEKRKQIDTANKELVQAENTLQLQSKIIAALPEKKVQLEKLEEQGKAIRRISDLQDKLELAKKALAEAQQAETEAQKIWQQKNREKEVYEQAWHHGQAAILAAELQDDTPCPVCGSTQHPDLAKATDKLPTEIELNKVRQAADEARNQLEKISREKLIKEEENKTLLNTLEEEKARNSDAIQLSLDAIRGQFAQCRDEINKLQKIVDDLPQLQQKVDGYKNAIKTLDLELQQTQQVVTERTGALAAARADLQHKEAEVPEQYRQAQTLEDVIKKTVAERDQLKQSIEVFNQQYQQAREAKVSAETALRSAQTIRQDVEKQFIRAISHWQSGLQQSAFVNEQAFLDARLENEAEAQFTKNIRQYEDDKLWAQKQLEEKNASIADKVRSDLNQLSETTNQCASAKNKIEEEFHKFQQRQQVLFNTRNRLDKLLQQQNKLEAEYGVIGRLSDISNGKNTHNLSLQRFVLSVLLDDVLTEASYRLHKMSKGRYQLYRKETVGDKRSKAGLELEVEDAYTGKQRPAATLSGGESFMAALALALGLSDVVQAYAGGIRLDTLFIDEGFGSLDPESLELAISTLLELRASGRMVGVISHVEEMKRIIDVRLDVIADREVSRTRLVGV